MPSRRAWAPTATWTRATCGHCAQAAKVGYALIANRAVPGISAVGLPVHSDSGLLLAAVTVATTHGHDRRKGCARCCRCCAARREIGELLRQ